jgi:hypothetical protein
MADAATKVQKWMKLLWWGVYLIGAFGAYALYQHDLSLLRGVLAVCGAYALVGVGFGIWAGQTFKKARAASE